MGVGLGSTWGTLERKGATRLRDRSAAIWLSRVLMYVADRWKWWCAWIKNTEHVHQVAFPAGPRGEGCHHRLVVTPATD